MKHLYKIMALFLLLAVAGGQCGFAQSYTVRVMSDTTVSICDSSIVWHGETITSSGNYEHLRDTVGDTIYVDSLHLTINTPTSSEETVSECVSYEWHNSLYTTGGDYTWTTTGSNGCDSVVTLHLTIYHPVHSALSDTTCGSFTWHGTIYTTSGDYTYSFQDANGCTQVDTLHLTVNPLPIVTIIATADTVCGGEVVLMANGNTNYSYQWSNGSSNSWISVDSTGSYSVTATDPNGCSNTVSKTITVNQPRHTMIDTTICQGESFDFFGESKTSTGVYVNTATATNGCDSIVTLVLAVNPAYYITRTVTICEGESHLFNGELLTQGGTYYDSLETVNGCDSIIELKLTVNPLPKINVVADPDSIVCEGGSITLIAEVEKTGTYLWNTGETERKITGINSTGTYTVTFTETATGCKNTASKKVIVNPVTYGDTTAVECESFTWHGRTYTETPSIAPTYRINEGNHYHCDSIVTLHLTILHGTHRVFVDTTCESYTWHGIKFDTTGIYIHSDTNADGCLNVDTLHLTIYKPIHQSYTITECESYVWEDGDGHEYTASGTYTYAHEDEHGCWQVDTLHLTINHPTNTAVTVSTCESYYWAANGLTYTTSGNYYYSHEGSNECTQVDTLHLTIKNPTHTSISQSACNSFTWNNTTYTESGDHVQTFQSANGCDSVVTLHLTLYHDTATSWSATGCESFVWNDSTYTESDTYVQYFKTVHGCDSVVTLNLTILHGTHNVEFKTVCESYTWHGTTYTISGTYLYPYTNAAGCASVDTLHLTVNYGTHNVEFGFACESYEWHGVIYTTSGTYTYAYNDADGCASVDTLHLTVNYGTHNVETETVCKSYTWHGTTYTTSGTYTYAYNNADGCPSVDTLKLTVNYGTHNVQIETACESYTWHGTTYTISGTYLYPYTNAAGCASVDTLHLTVNYGTHNVEFGFACESYEWHGVIYTTSGTYTYAYNNADGCASVDTLHLTVNYGTHNVETETVCESYTWHGTTYTTSGTYTYAYNNADGCPSVDTLKLTLNYGTHNVQIETACESYTWHGTTYTISGTYLYPYTNAAGCASVDTLHLTVNHGTHNVEFGFACESYEWHGVIYTTSGTYTYAYNNADGCASVDTLHLTVNYGTHNVETETVCESYTWHGTTYTTSGTYTYAYNNADGCPSVDTLKLTVNYGTHNVINETACESYTWYGVTYTVSDIYTHLYTNTYGCASVDTLHLTINNPTHTAIRVDTCDNFTWLDGTGQNYTTTGTYTYAHIDANGCTQVDTLYLTIYPLPIPLITGDNTFCPDEVATLVAGGGTDYVWSTGETTNQIQVETPDTYTVTVTDAYGCSADASFTVTYAPMSLEQLPIVAKRHADGTPYMLVYPQAGLRYQWYKGGDPIPGETQQYYAPDGGLLLNTSYKVHVAPMDPDSCGLFSDEWTYSGTASTKVRILPNPNSGHFRLLLPEGTANVQILDANGLTVMTRTTDGATELEMDTSLANGLYFVKTFRKNGSSNVEKLIINR